MKNGAASSASIFLKHVISALCSITKAKSMAIRNKTSTLKARLAVMSLIKNKKFSLGSISHKIQAVLGQQDKIKSDDDDGGGDQSKAIVLYNASAPSVSDHEYCYGYGDDDKYPDLTHTLFEEEDELDLGDPNGSVIDLVRSSKEGGDEDFKLEDEIDHVADLFILKFHKRIRLQKLESFKRYQEMLDRSA